MNKATTNVSFRIDSKVKVQADKLFSQLGLTMTTAFNVFLRQSIREGSIPFPITINTPNNTTIAAISEAEHIASDPTVKRYTDVEEALRALKS